MRKTDGFFLLIVFCAGLVFFHGSVSANLSGKQNSYAMAYPVLKESCAGCHSAELKLPFYARVPGIKQIFKHGHDEAIVGLTMDTEVHAENKPPLPTALDGIERTIRDGSMPPLYYRMTHWGSGLSDTEKQAIYDWIREERAAA